MASQFPRAYVMCPEAQEYVPVEGVVVIQRESVKVLEERQRKDEVLMVPYFESGHRKNLVYAQKLGILQKETGNR